MKTLKVTFKHDIATSRPKVSGSSAPTANKMSSRMVGPPAQEEAIVKSVRLTVFHPSTPVKNTFTFEKGGPDSWEFKAPEINTPEGPEDAKKFAYQTKVDFEDPSLMPYTSPKSTSTDSEVVLLNSSIEIKSVTFTALNINFPTEVTNVLVSFFFLNENGGEHKAQTLNITENDTPYLIKNLTMGVGADKYQYSLTYLMKDGAQFKAESIQGTSQTVYIPSPFVELSVSLFAIWGDPNELYHFVVDAKYTDATNSLKESHKWTKTYPSGGPAPEIMPWSYPGIQNQAATIEYSGTIILADGQQRILPSITTHSLNIFVSPTQYNYSVEFNSILVAWTDVNIIAVVVNTYTMDKNNVRSNQGSFQFLPEGKTSWYWSFLVDFGSDIQVKYYYYATYYYESSSMSYLSTTQSSTSSIMLPGNANGTIPPA